ncbi:MAG: diadenylate cyclase CdaA [Syntrophorhabdaceae bacterium]|nr:diadenylate cyclase CdaA [Syntrophorhabdaceae bacterium]MDD4196499.1 diadenylate cyclase CdaA [Syntrophorhabdaceae bacterium]
MIPEIRWQDIVDIIIVAFIIYRVFLLIKGTRAIQLLLGLVIVMFVFAIAKRLELFTLSWIFNSFIGSIVFVVIVIFQDDLRRLLLALGRSPFFRKISYLKETMFLDELANACLVMKKRAIGALIVLEREVGLEEFMEAGVRFDAEVNAELVVSIFQFASPLHDGGLIIREGRIVSAGCVLPLTTAEEIDKNLGTRHRAAIGITEVTDAVSIVVSEEQGIISYAQHGQLHSNITTEELKKVLKEVLA